MDLRDSLLILAQKLSHRIPEIRDRSMKALTTKLLSPLVTDDHFKILSESHGFTASILEWINERYDVCDFLLLRDVFSMCEKVLTRSEVIRMAFLDVGGVSFFDEFGLHNSSMRDQVDRVVTAMLGGRTPERVTGQIIPEPDVVSVKAIQQFDAPHATISSNEEEQILFDLAVRIKFGTSATSVASVEDVVCALMHSVGPNYPSRMFLDFPMIVEAICNQLKMSNSINSLPHHSCDALITLLDHIILRLLAEQVAIPVSWIFQVVGSLIESFSSRPGYIYRTAPLAIQLVSLTPENHNWTLVQLESLVRTIAVSVETTFSPQKYFVEKFEFKDSIVPVLLRRLCHPLTPAEFLVAQLAIDILDIASVSPEDIVGMSPQSIELVRHVSDWICDMQFYASSPIAHSVATRAANVDDSFSQAREVIVSMKKLKSGEILTHSDFHNLFAIHSRVAEIVNPQTVMYRLFEQGEWALISEAVATSSGLADALIESVSDGLEPPSLWALNSIAFNQASRPRQFVDAVLKISHVQFFNSESNDLSIQSNVLSLFSTNSAIQKQAIVALWCQYSGKPLTECPFDSLPLRSTPNRASKYKLNAMNVSEDELSSAIKLAFNRRLTDDIRTASIAQACTLIVNASNPVFLVGSEDVFSDECVDMGDLVCCLLDFGCIQTPRGETLDALLERLVSRLFLSHQSDEILRILARLSFSRFKIGTDSDDVYWGFLNQLNLIGDFCLMDLNNPMDQQKIPTTISLTDRVVAICVSLEMAGDVVSTIETSDSPCAIEAALHAHVPTSGLDRFILSMEALVDTDGFIRLILEPAIRIAKLLPPGDQKNALLSAIDRVTDSINLDTLNEYEVATLVSCRAVSDSPAPNWISALLTTDSQSVVNSVLRFFLLSRSPCLYEIESAVFRFPSQFSLLAWMYLLSRSDSIEMTSLEKISQLLDNDGLVGEMAWHVLVRFRNHFPVDDTRVWEKALDRMDTIQSANRYVADSVRLSAERAQYVLDTLDLSRCSLDILHALSKSNKGFELARFLSESDFWPNLSSGDPNVVLDLILECCRDNHKLFVYIVHTGAIDRVVLPKIQQPSEPLIELIVRANTICSSGLQLNHFHSLLEWICSDAFFQLISKGEANADLFELCRVAAIFLRDQCHQLPVWDSLDLLTELISENTLLNADACAAFCELARIGTRRSDVDGGTKLIIFDLMKFHDLVPVPDSGSLFFGQVRFISILSSVAPSMHEEYARWFSCIWQRSLSIVETRKTSNISILTELVCGFIEVVSRHPNSKSLSQPLSFILSYATRSGEISPSMFSLCLSVGEAAAPLLIDKPVAGKIVHNLISLHATVHARNKPKSIEAISRLGSIVRFVSGMVGCQFSGAQVMEILDGWSEAMDVIDHEVLVCVLGAIVVSSSSAHLRTSLVSTEKGRYILSQIVTGDNPVGSLIIEVLQATSFKFHRELSGA